VGEEAVHPGLAPSGQALAKVDKVPNGLKVVLILALLGRGATAVGEDVGQQRGVADLLVGHELDQGDVFRGDAGRGEFLGAEPLDTVVEEVAERSARRSEPG
jgi:hypothetical protein